MESVCVLYGVDIIGGGGGGFKIQCGALSKGGGALKKHKDMRGGGVLKKIPVQRRGSPEKNAKW